MGWKRNFKEENVQILLVGATGSGKSSTGNTILSVAKGTKEQFFHTGTGSDPKTKVNKKWTRVILGRNVTVVDTPGADNTRDNPWEIQKEIREAIEKSNKPFDAILLVVRVFKEGLEMTDEELKTVEVVQTILGEDFWKYGIFIFTHADNFEKMLESIRLPDEPKASFQEFVEMHSLTKNKFAIGKYLDQVNFAAVKFENNEPDATKREKMVENLLLKVYDLKEKNHDVGYGMKNLPPEQFKIPDDYYRKKTIQRVQDLGVWVGNVMNSDVKIARVIMFVVIAVITAVICKIFSDKSNANN